MLGPNPAVEFLDAPGLLALLLLVYEAADQTPSGIAGPLAGAAINDVVRINDEVAGGGGEGQHDCIPYV